MSVPTLSHGTPPDGGGDVKLRTGLKPSAFASALRPGSNYVSLPLRVDEGLRAVTVPADIGPVVWIVQLRTAWDTVEHRRGTIRAMLVAPVEPRITERSVQIAVDRDPDEVSGYERHIRDANGIPEDAPVRYVGEFVDGRLLGSFRELTWWEVQW
ncbi:hypothetical protein [Microbacterium caowuchunii]|uniref:Uncharacterized protein n=1 Tax=Microbacterium caowuchunii TaxID=2614638 RepID=A0A5N0TFD5_9MICO|nr:hypothetical protein [Microbacterium caowuchunii]KAA9133740.1 hypothetical protein F6B40_08280 [Microbacterium caowuchunii]